MSQKVRDENPKRQVGGSNVWTTRPESVQEQKNPARILIRKNNWKTWNVIGRLETMNAPTTTLTTTTMSTSLKTLTTTTTDVEGADIDDGGDANSDSDDGRKKCFCFLNRSGFKAAIPSGAVLDR